MHIQIGAKPESTFENPIGLLSDCHRRIEKFLAQLIDVAESDCGGELCKEHREALDVALRYFRQAAPLHTADEEASLFPRMRAVGGPDVQAAMDAVDRLESDHRVAEEAHAEIDALGSKWLQVGALSGQEKDRLLFELRTLRTMYERHIAVEDDSVFPLAGEMLDPDAIRQVGREMAIRRGLDPDNLPRVSRCAERRLNVVASQKPSALGAEPESDPE